MPNLEKVRSMHVRVRIDISDGSTTRDEIMAILDNFEAAIKNYVTYDSTHSEIQMLHVQKLDDYSFTVDAEIEVPKPKEAVPAHS